MATVTHGIATAATTNGTSYASGAFTPAANDLLFVFVVASDTTDAATTLTGTGGSTFTRSRTTAFRTGTDRIVSFVSDKGVTATSQTVTFGCAGDAATGAVIFVIRVAGIGLYGTAALRQTSDVNNAAAGGTPAASFSAACLTDNVTLGCIGNSTNPATVTPPTSWTEDAAGDTGYATPTTGGEYVYRNSGFTGTTMTWGSTSASAFGVSIVEINASRLVSPRVYPHLLAH